MRDKYVPPYPPYPYCKICYSRNIVKIEYRTNQPPEYQCETYHCQTCKSHWQADSPLIFDGKDSQ